MALDASFPALLERLERAMLAQAPHYRTALRPGATTKQLRAAEDALGLELPQVVVDWFTWHDGADVFPDTTAVGIGPAHLRPRTLAESVKDTALMRQIAAESTGGIDRPADRPPPLTAEQLYPYTVISVLAYDPGDVCIDTSDGALYWCDVWNTEKWLSYEADSLQATVAEWVRRLEDGTWTYDQATSRWDAPPVDAEQRRRFSPVLYERELPLATDIWPYT